MAGKKWIGGLSKGGLHRSLGVPAGEKIPPASLAAAEKSAKPGSKVAKQIQAAKTLAKLRRK